MVQLEVTRRRVTRVTIEYADGYVSELTGDDADKYQQLVIEQGVHAWNHGMPSPQLPWKQRNKNCAMCGGMGEVLGELARPSPCTECSKGPK